MLGLIAKAGIAISATIEDTTVEDFDYFLP
jgi:hypothetical protein